MFPRRSGEPVSVNETVDIRGQCKAVPVDHRFGRYRRPESIRFADDPRSQHAATAATGDIKLIRIDIAFRQRSIHTRHQVIVIVARVSMMNQVAELLAIGSTAARIGIKHHIARTGIKLDLGRKPRTIVGKRSTVNFQDQRVFLRRVKAWRLDDPAMHRSLIEAALKPDLLDLAQFHVRQQIVIDRRQFARLATATINNCEVGRAIRANLREGDPVMTGDAETRCTVWAPERRAAE